MYKHTLCFIKRNEEILMLNREYDPVKGLWNGVGGKIEKGETPLENAIREIKEETNIKVTYDQIQFKGIIKWEDSSYSGGMYVYLVELLHEFTYHTPKIAIDDPTFNSEVIYLDGKNKYYKTWHKTQIKDINIINWTETNKGTGISLYSAGKENEISFVNFENIKVVGMETGLKLVAKKTSTGQAWINANRFMNFSLEDCVNMIYMDSQVTAPNEISGNQFTNLQIQLSNKTKSIIKVSGQYNEFHGMVWDLQKISHENELIELTDKSMNTVIEMSSVPANRILDSGKSNIVK